MKIKSLSQPKYILIILALTSCSLSFAQNSTWEAPIEANALKSPITADDKAIAKGKKIYYQVCAVCHGRSGIGNGPNAKTLKRKPADHTSEAVQSQSDGALYWKISKGNDPMPSYIEVFSKTQRWQVIAYIRTLKSSNE